MTSPRQIEANRGEGKKKENVGRGREGVMEWGGIRG